MNNPGQHGRQPTPQAAPPADPRMRNGPTGPTTTGTSVTETSGICRDYIWGICVMREQCIYRHDLEYEAMKETLKFCHDHQNRTGCTRPDCTYLHTSRDEENLFLTTGQIPRVLLERYASMSYMTPSVSRAESAPPHMAIYDFIAQPPPPPPPPPAQSGPMLHSPRQKPQQQMQATMIISPIQGPIQGAMNGGTQGPMQGPMPCPMPNPIQGPVQGPMPCPMPGPMPGPIQSPMPGPMQGPMQHPMQGPMTGSAVMPQMPAPMQPPPPPPPPPTSSGCSSRMSAPVYTGGHHASSNPVSAQYQPTVNQQSLPALFDPTRPPPPIFQKPSTLKRSAEDCEAGPSKLRKSENSNESSCEKCVRRLLRLELYTQETEQMKKENEIARAESAAMAQEFERRKRLIQSLVRPEVYRLIEEYIESNSNSPNKSSTATLLNSLLGMFVGRDAEPAPSTSDAALLQQLTSRLRPSTNGSSADLLTSLLDMVRKSPTERNSSESRSAAVSVGNGPARSFSESGPSTSRLFEAAGHSSSRLYESAGPSSSRPYEGAGPSPSRPYDGAGPAPSRPYDGAGPAPSRPYDGAGPSPSRPYDGAGPSPSRPYDGAVPPPSRPYDSTVASTPTTYAEMCMGPYEPVRYPPPSPSTLPVKGQYHAGMELLAMPQGARPGPAPSVQISGPGPYGSQQAHLQAQGPPSRPPFYVHIPSYNGANPPYPGMVPQQAARPPMQPPQNPPNNLFFGTRYPNYYPPYQ